MLFTICKSQRLDSRWALGGPYSPPSFYGIDFDFSSGSLMISTVQRDMIFFETNGQICDNNGNLLFFSNGIYIANAQNDTMLNGDGINPGPFTTSNSNTALPLPQGNLVIPFPGDSTKYYLFHETSDDPHNTWATYYLYNSIIDMSLDAGLGAVIQKNNIVLQDTLVEGRLTACKHANGRDWWLIVHKYNSGSVFKFLITDQGISSPILQDMVTIRDNCFGQNLFSPQGNKFAYYDPCNDLDIWDFDRCTGEFSNLIHIDINDSSYSGGLAFSESGRYLYAVSTNYVYQFDLLATSIDSSKITVGVYDGYLSGGLSATFFLSALAPDGKIYSSCTNGTTVLHVINYPDSAGLACGFCQHCIALPAYNNFTIPNHPNYSLQAEGGTICDSLPTSITKENFIYTNDYNIFPNPSEHNIYLLVTGLNIETISIYNSIGELIKLEFDLIKNEYLHFDISSLNTGFYYLELMTADKKIVRRFIKN